jgi:hypothetical protein
MINKSKLNTILLVIIIILLGIILVYTFSNKLNNTENILVEKNNLLKNEDKNNPVKEEEKDIFPNGYTKILKINTEDESVYLLGAELRELGFYSGVNGTLFNQAIYQAVKDFQKSVSLKETGIADSQTLNKLSAEISKHRASLLIRRCPEKWVNNQMPCSGDCAAPQYYILDGKRWEIFQFDKLWLSKNCNLKMDTVY